MLDMRDCIEMCALHADYAGSFEISRLVARIVVAIGGGEQTLRAHAVRTWVFESANDFELKVVNVPADLTWDQFLRTPHCVQLFKYYDAMLGGISFVRVKSTWSVPWTDRVLQWEDLRPFEPDAND